MILNNPKSRIEITLLVDDTSKKEGVRAEHGLSWAIRTDSEFILFDTGQGEALTHNAAALGFNLGTLSHIILSHGHYDHSGGLPKILSVAPFVRVYSHPATIVDRYYSHSSGKSCIVSMPDEAKRCLSDIGTRWIKKTYPMEILGAVWTTGSIPRKCAFEVPDLDFCLDSERNLPDPFEDDQAVFIRSKKGTIVLLGCAHAGVTNTLCYIQELTDQEPIYAVLGGMHLIKASKDRIEGTIKTLKELDIQIIAPCHCSGQEAKKTIEQAIPKAYVDCSASFSLTFEM